MLLKDDKAYRAITMMRGSFSMDKKIILVFLIAVVIIGFVVFEIETETEVVVNYWKFTEKKEIPDKLLIDLAERELQRGVYYYSNPQSWGYEGDKNVVCLVLVGGENYKEGYDADITTIHYKLEDAWTNKGRVTSASYFPHVREYDTSERYDYSKGFDLPFVVFIIEETFSEYDGVQRGVYVDDEDNWPMIDEWMYREK